MKSAQSIKYYRKKAGLTQIELAEKTGLSLSTIQRYEQDKNEPELITCSKIADALKIPVEEIFSQKACEAEPAQSIKYYRKKAGLTQIELAEKTGLSIASIQGYEQSKYSPKLETRRKLADALGIPPEKLLGDAYANFVELSNNVRRILAGNVPMEADERVEQLENLFFDLNTAGQEKALEMLEILTKVPEYKTAEGFTE